MTQTLFLDRLTNRLDLLASAITTLVDNRLDSAKADVPCRIDREVILESVPNDIRDLIKGSVPRQIFALTYTATEATNRYYSPWLSRAIIDAEKMYGCSIYVKTNDQYSRMEQFAEINHPVRLVAVGEEPKQALLYALAEERKFDSKLFDEDGFLK